MISQKQRIITLLISTTLFLGLSFTTPAAIAGVVSQVDPMTFGTIDLHPAGDTILIDAQGGPAPAQAGRSLVTGGTSGLITITSATAEHVDIIYPTSAVLSDAPNSITITNIPTNSQYSTGGFDLPGNDIAVDVSVGGELVLPGNTIYGSYTGSMNIIINFS